MKLYVYFKNMLKKTYLSLSRGLFLALSNRIKMESNSYQDK
jgi:hypothetical protein